MQTVFIEREFISLPDQYFVAANDGKMVPGYYYCEGVLHFINDCKEHEFSSALSIQYECSYVIFNCQTSRQGCLVSMQ